MRKMRKNILIFVSLLVLLSNGLYSQLKGMKALSKETGKETQVYDQSYALLIGINKYKEWPTLDYAVNDAKAVGELLVQRFAFDLSRVKYLIDEQATLQNIKNALSDIAAKATENDRVLVYYSGHGQTLELKGGGQMGFLVPVEGSTRDDRLYSTCLPMADVKTISSLISAKHILFLVDACYSGLAASTQRGLPPETKLYLKQIASEKGRQVITAGSKGEASEERSEWGHGAFTYELLEGLGTGLADLDNDGIITSQELGEFLKSKVARISQHKQTPQFKFLTDEEGEFVFLCDGEVTTSAGTTPEEVKKPSVGTVKTLYGNLQIDNFIDGQLYIDGKEISKVSSGTVIPVNNLTVGDHVIKIASARGDFVVSSTVEEGKTTTLTSRLLSPTGLGPQAKINVPASIDDMVWVEGGSFEMGSNDGDVNEKPVHRVSVDGFYMDKYEVSVAKFKQFVDVTGYRTEAEKLGYGNIWTGSSWEKRSGVDWRCDEEGNLRQEDQMNHPVIHVSWNDAIAFARWAGKRLPTEAEWEYAAKCGSKQYKYSWGNGEPVGKKGGNIADEAAKRKCPGWTVLSGYDDGFVFSSPIGYFEPNDFGLYDMTGNVWEWCSDWYDKDYYRKSPEQNPQGPSNGGARVTRGGAWNYLPSFARSATRVYDRPWTSYCDRGFRCVRTK